MPLWRKTHQSHIARQRVVTERLRRAHLLLWKSPRYALDHSIWIDSRWQRRQQRETCGVFHGRQPNVHRSLSRKGLSVTKPRIAVHTNTIGKYTNIQYIGVIKELLRVKDSSSIKRDQTRSSFTTLHFRCASIMW